jgi:hypothetical protein
VQIRLLAEAQRRFEAEDEWWRENRDAKELFTDEFEQTLERLTAEPEVGQVYRGRRGAARDDEEGCEEQKRAK